MRKIARSMTIRHQAASRCLRCVLPLSRSRLSLCCRAAVCFAVGVAEAAEGSPVGVPRVYGFERRAA